MPEWSNGMRSRRIDLVSAEVRTLSPAYFKMKSIIKKEERFMHKNSEQCWAYEYLFGDKDVDIAYIEIKGRYPDEGLAMNDKIKEIILIIEGNGKIFIDGKENSVEEGDAILLLPKQKYFWQGNFKLAISCNPIWDPEQHRNIK